MRKIVIALLAIALSMAAAAGETPDPFAQARLEWNKPQAPFHIISNIYYVGPAGVSAYLIVTPQGHILTDGGLPESADQIEANIKALGFNLKDVKILLNSHAHFDHAGGLAQLKRDTGARLFVSAADRPAVESGRIDFGPSMVDPFPPVSVDHVVTDGEEIALSGVRLTAMITPGHTRGCTNWIMPLLVNGVPHKVMFFCSITTGGNPLVNNAAYPTIASDYRASFARLKVIAKGIDIFFAPHGDQMDLVASRAALEKSSQTNPFVDKDRFGVLLKRMEKSFEDELARQTAGPQSDVALIRAQGEGGTEDEKPTGTFDKLFTSTLVVDNVPVKSYGIDKSGLFTLVLATGEIWTQQSSDTVRAHWKTLARPLMITIRQGSLGTYNMEVRGDIKRYEVRPVDHHL